MFNAVVGGNAEEVRWCHQVVQRLLINREDPLLYCKAAETLMRREQ